MSRTLELIISYVLGFPAYIFLWPNHSTHHTMVKRDYYVKRLKKASYKDLKEAMDKVEWEYDPSWPDSLFDKDDANYFHADIIRFGDVGYLLTPYGYIMSKFLQKRIRKRISGDNISKPYVTA